MIEISIDELKKTDSGVNLQYINTTELQYFRKDKLTEVTLEKLIKSADGNAKSVMLSTKRCNIIADICDYGSKWILFR